MSGDLLLRGGKGNGSRGWGVGGRGMKIGEGERGTGARGDGETEGGGAEREGMGKGRRGKGEGEREKGKGRRGNRGQVGRGLEGGSERDEGNAHFIFNAVVARCQTLPQRFVTSSGFNVAPTSINIPRV